MGLADMRLAVLPGAGLVGRFSGAVVLLAGSDVDDAIAGRILDVCRAGEGAGAELRALVKERPAGLPAFCALVHEAEGVGIYVHGALSVGLTLRGSHLDLASTEADGWIEETLRGDIRSVLVAPKKAVATSALVDLVEGVVPGGGMSLELRSAAAKVPAAVQPPPPAVEETPAVEMSAAPVEEAPPAPPVPEPAPPVAAEVEPNIDATLPPVQPIEPPAPAPAPAEPEPAPVVAEAAPDPDRTQHDGAGDDFQHKATVAVMPTSQIPIEAVMTGDGPPIEGKLCTAGHLTDPTLETCIVCGQEVSMQLATGPRPALGRLVGPGIDMLVERDLVIGRKAEEAPEVVAGQVGAVATPATEMAVSRLHADFKIQGWSVLVADRSSANGTFLRPPGASEWIRLEPGHEVRVMFGSELRLGPLVLAFVGPNG